MIHFWGVQQCWMIKRWLIWLTVLKRSRETRDLLVAANCLQMPKRRRSGTEGRPALWAGNMLIPKIGRFNRSTIANGGCALHDGFSCRSKIVSDANVYREENQLTLKHTHLVLEGHISPNIYIYTHRIPCFA